MKKIQRLFSGDWAASVLVAFVIHFFFFFGSGFAFVQMPKYGVQAASGGIEVSLVAALPAAADAVSARAQKTADADGEVIEEAPENTRTQTLVEKSEPGQDQQVVRNETPYVGDGSSKVPGISSTTLYSPGGGSTEDRAGYLKNPPPPYPQAAIDRGQEGRVVLLVRVDAAGKPAQVELKTSSGFRLLDQSAVKTVRRWKFEPAHIGALRVETVVEIPVRFVLEDELKRRR